MTRKIEKQGMDHSDEVRLLLYKFQSQIYFAFIKFRMEIKNTSSGRKLESYIHSKNIVGQLRKFL